VVRWIAAAWIAGMDESSLISHEAYGPDIAGVLIPRHRIASRLDELAGRITETYPEGELTILAALTGSLIFLSDLIRRLPLRLRVDVVRVSSYPHQATASRESRVLIAPAGDLPGRHVLIIDDILDTGKTLELIRGLVLAAGAASARTCVLMSKRRDDLPARAAADFVGFDIEDQFVVGYGLDYGDLYRNLPDICLLRDLAGGNGR
jgi:hypoxanthine phosphoribosyltransferase